WPPHCQSGREHGDGAHVCLHRRRRGDRRRSQHRRCPAGSAKPMAIMRADALTSSPAAWLLRHPGVSRLGVVIVLLGAWEVAARFWIDRSFLSPPSLVVASLGEIVGTKGVASALWLTLYELAVAFVLSVIIGTSAGLAIGLSRFARRSFMPIVLLLYGIP